MEDMEMLLVSTYLDYLLLEGREMLLSVHDWTLSYWRTGKCFSLYVHCWGWTGNSLSLYTLDSLLVEDMDMILSVKTWTLC